LKQEASSVKIRKAVSTDLPEITEIYNEAILTTNATFDSEPKTVAQQEIWFSGHNRKHPVLVAENHTGVIGWASLSEWSTRCAYADTAEISIYIKEAFRGQGIGKQLMREVMKAGKKCGLHTVLSRITDDNQASIHLHELAGFENIGVMKEVGFKFNRLLDVRLMQYIYRRKAAK
jgi:L-amino acid N-acyltransferase